MDQFPEQFEEYQVPYSNALQCRRRGGGAYFVGPLARWNINADRATPEVARARPRDRHRLALQEPLRRYRRPRPRNRLCGRGGDPIDRVSRAARGSFCLLSSLGPARARGSPRRPRGILYHRYEADATGHVTHATIIPPTSQNQRQMEEDLIRFAPSVLDLPEDQAAWRCEQVVRNYDPCISCATHSLKLRVVES